MTWQFMLNIYYWFICCQYSCNLNFFFIKMGVLFWPETGEFCSCEAKFNWGKPSNLINDKYQIEYENETRFFGVTCSCTACYCWRHHLSTKFWLGRELFFFRKEAYYLEENAKIFVLTNSFIHPCQCLHKMMNEIPLNKIEI